MKRMWSAVVAAGLVTLSGCSNDGGEPAGTPSPTTTPTLAEPVELDYYATLTVDDDAGHALVTDWVEEKLRAIDSAGKELWSIDAYVNDEGGGSEAYSAGDLVIVNDYSGTVTAYTWEDGEEAWSFDIPGPDDSCHEQMAFGSRSTGLGNRLREDDLLLLEYSGMRMDGDCAPTSEAGNAVMFALDPSTGTEAWPSLSIDDDGRTFGGKLTHLAPDRKSAVMSWKSGEDSMVTRISLDTGHHVTVPITAARSIDDTGIEHFDVFPTSDETTLTYLFGAEDPDDPMSQAFSRVAELTVPAGLEESDSPTLDSDYQSDGAKMEHTTDPVCSTDFTYTPEGQPACLQVQLFASAVKYQGSDGSPRGWFADAPEMAVDTLLYTGSPTTVPFDSSGKTAVLAPGPDGGAVAIDAATGKTAWNTGKYRSTTPWGGQGVLPDVGLVVLTDNKKTSFYDMDTGRLVDEHKADEYDQLTSGFSTVLVAGETSTTMWAVVDK
ncbi:PQQ-like domain-containing protein [Brevibacterium siliguriense]|uniref:PQQ-like domain-containing protein n=1 Tax=Brevibacterium siliguriense TaxID=1136497 RepID=A0A1H1PCQ9_9MICO|nr:PQQ-binding-like beta-propeller repeat protein [Brevibacterium siliguriense]SDS09022.1 PQQ-like domain-containing protein [Brevibacterium siliguriense]